MMYFSDKVRFYSGVPSKCKDVFLDLETRNDEQETFKTLLKNLTNKDFWAISVLGTVGNGKTTLACAAVNTWNDNHNFYDLPGYYTTQENLTTEYKESFDNNSVSEAQVFNKFARKAKFLVIDELNPNSWTDFNKNLIQKILVERYANERATVIIGNLTAEQFKSMFDPHILSRLREGETLYMTAKDMRTKGDRK